MSDVPAPRFVPSLERTTLGLSGDRSARDERPAFYALDNAATIMPATSGETCTSLFRLSVDFDEDVDRDRLQVALDATVARFPYLAVELRRGFFWYYLVPTTRPILVEDDAPSPCQGFDPNRRGTCLFRVRARGARLAAEFSHIVADGKGAIRFMKTLVAEYCRLGGVPAAADDPDIYDLAGRPSPVEWEDAYDRHYEPGLPVPVMGRKAFHVDGALLDTGLYRVTTGRLPLAAAVAAAKSRGATLTEFFTAVYLDSLQELWLEAPAAARRHTQLAAEIPVDMRRHYPTASNRNFTLFIIVGQDMRLGPRDFPSILERVKLQSRLENDARELARQISRNVNGTRHPLINLIPLRVKDFAARILAAALGEDYVSGVVMNLGPVDFPEGPAGRIRRFDLAQAPSTKTKANLAIHSHAGELYVTVSSLAREPKLEDCVFRRLAALGLPARLDSYGGAPAD